MLTNEQIDTIHRLHFVEKWTIRKIAKHLHVGRRSVAKYLSKPVQTPLHRTRTSKLDSFKPAIGEWLQQDPSVTAAVGRFRAEAGRRDPCPQDRDNGRLYDPSRLSLSRP